MRRGTGSGRRHALRRQHGHPGRVAVADIRANKFFEPMGRYALGCLDAALGLFERANADRGYVDYAFYPAAQSLRHGLELFIKQMTIYIAYEMRRPDFLYERGHDLQEQWNAIRDWVRSNFQEAALRVGDDPRHSLEVVEALISEFHRLDPKGTLFRYPEDVVVREKRVMGESDKKEKTRRLVETPVPFDSVDFDEWARAAREALGAAQEILYHAAEHAAEIAYRRGHHAFNFHRLAMGETQTR